MIAKPGCPHPAVVLVAPASDSAVAPAVVAIALVATDPLKSVPTIGH